MVTVHSNILTGLALMQMDPLLAQLDLSSLELPVAVVVGEKVYPEYQLVNSWEPMRNVILATPSTGMQLPLAADRVQCRLDVDAWW